MNEWMNNDSNLQLQEIWGKYLYYDGKYQYKGSDNSLARPGKKQTTATEDFDFNISYL